MESDFEADDSEVTNNKKEQWDMYLVTCVFAYNKARQESTLHSPFELMFGRKANLPVDIENASHIGEKILEEYKASADNKHVSDSPSIGHNYFRTF